MIGGYDGGNANTKAWTPHGIYKQPSALGEWRKRNLRTDFGDDAVEFEYNGERGFAGTLAKYESEFIREMVGETKAHNDAKLRVLIAIHRFGGNDRYHDIVVGQPISRYTDDEKAKIKRMFKGEHTMTVNNVTKTFTVREVNVSPEGAAVYYATNVIDEVVRIIEIGSGTVNMATIINGNFIDKGSDTLDFGADSTKTSDIKALVNATIAKSTKLRWSPSDKALVAGGEALNAEPYISEYFANSEVVKPVVQTASGLKRVHPVYANVVGFGELAKVIYGG